MCLFLIFNIEHFDQFSNYLRIFFPENFSLYEHYIFI